MVANDSLELLLIDVAMSTRCKDVITTVPGGVSATAVGTGGLQSEQNMLRSATGWPALLRAVVGCLISSWTTGMRGASLAAGKPLASTIDPTAVAAKYADSITASAPTSQK